MMYSHNSEPARFERDCDVIMVPSGDEVSLPAGPVGYITQALGGSFTLFVEGHLFRLDGRDADDLDSGGPQREQNRHRVVDPWVGIDSPSPRSHPGRLPEARRAQEAPKSTRSPALFAQLQSFSVRRSRRDWTPRIAPSIRLYAASRERGLSRGEFSDGGRGDLALAPW